MTPLHDEMTARRSGHDGRAGDADLAREPSSDVPRAGRARLPRAAMELSGLEDARLAELGVARSDIERTIDLMHRDAVAPPASSERC